MNWLNPSGLNADDLLKESEQRTLFIFKHSSRCSISAMAFNRMEKKWAHSSPVYLIPVIEQRPLSSALAAALGIAHESPQILVVKNRKCVYHASHGSIDPAAIPAD